MQGNGDNDEAREDCMASNVPNSELVRLASVIGSLNFEFQPTVDAEYMRSVEQRARGVEGPLRVALELVSLGALSYDKGEPVPACEHEVRGQLIDAIERGDGVRCDSVLYDSQRLLGSLSWDVECAMNGIAWGVPCVVGRFGSRIVNDLVRIAHSRLLRDCSVRA